MKTELPLSYILIDTAMRTWLNQNADSQAKTLQLKRLPSSQDKAVGNLQSERIKTCKGGGAIRVAPFRNSGHYEVIDGRHRTVLAIQEGNTTIDAIIETDEYNSQIDNMFV